MTDETAEDTKKSSARTAAPSPAALQEAGKAPAGGEPDASDLTHGRMGGKILAYAIPLAITGILEQMYNTTDNAVVGHYLGADAMAAVGSMTPVISLIVTFFVGISLGANVVIAQATGRGDAKAIHSAVHTSILFSLICGVVMTIVCEPLVGSILRWTGVPSEVEGMSGMYLSIYLLGLPVVLLYNFESAVFRSRGRTVFPLIALVVSSLANLVLDLWFVCGLHWGVGGAAIATVIANVISAAILLVFLHTRHGSPARLAFHDLRIDKNELKQILAIGVPSGLQASLFSISNIIIQSSVNSLGATVMAASSAAFSLEVIAYYVMNSFNQACTTFVGQNYGAMKMRRCRRAFAICMGEGYVATAVTCVTILLFSTQLLGIFNNDPEVIHYATIRLEYIFFAYIFSIWQEVGSGYLRGFGMSMIPALISVVGVCVLRIFWVLTIFRISPTFTTLMEIYPITLGVTGVAIVIAILIARPSRRYATLAGAQREELYVE